MEEGGFVVVTKSRRRGRNRNWNNSKSQAIHDDAAPRTKPGGSADSLLGQLLKDARASAEYERGMAGHPDQSARFRATERAMEHACTALVGDQCASNSLSQVRKELAQFVHAQQSAPPRPLQVVVYGLGSLVNGRAARFQFAALLSLFGQSIDRGVGPLDTHSAAATEDDDSSAGLRADRMVGYDPIWSRLEHDLLLKHNIHPLDCNEAGWRPVHDDQPTLFYMPHCGCALYRQVLGANVVEGTLHNTVILGNSLSRYCDAPNPDPALVRARDQLLVREQPLFAELSPKSTLYDAFNDLSLHFFQNSPDSQREKLCQLFKQPISTREYFEKKVTDLA